MERNQIRLGLSLFVLAAGVGMGLAAGCSSPGDEAEPTSTVQQALLPCDPASPFNPPVAAFTGTQIVDGITFSQDGLKAYLSGKVAGASSYNIYVSTRTSTTEFQTLTEVPGLNTTLSERAPSLSADGTRLYFGKQLSSGTRTNLMVSTISGGVVGTPSQITNLNFNGLHEQDPFFVGGQLFYAKEPVDGQRDLYVSTYTAPSTYSNGVAFAANGYDEYRPVLSSDRLTLYFSSTRAGVGDDTGGDLWVVKRASINDAFSFSSGQIKNLYTLNTSRIEFPAGLSNDGCTLYFASNRDTTNVQDFRLYQASRGTNVPATITTTIKIVGTGSIITAPYQCSTTCAFDAPPDEVIYVEASAQAIWSGSCSPYGGGSSSDGAFVFSNGGTCTVTFPNGLSGQGGGCLNVNGCQSGLECTLNVCRCTPGSPGCTCAPTCPSNACLAPDGCGGTCPCEPGEPCFDDTDCGGGAKCCGETCGGEGCDCGTATQCAPGLECASGLCNSGPPPHCSNNVQDAGETDVDCGGTCSGCDAGGTCAVAVDCASGLDCVNGTCQCVPQCMGAACGASDGCGGTCPCGPGEICNETALCTSGLVCWENASRRFGKAGGQGICVPPVCITSPYLGGCGDQTAPCGACTGEPRACVIDADCANGEVCGTDNGAAFNLDSDADVCWPPFCEQPATTITNCGTADSACGKCDCSTNCAGKSCGDDPSDGCGGYCSGLCDDGEAGCNSSTECQPGSVCGLGVGPRFGHPAGTSACWPADCTAQDQRLPNGGVDPSRCGVSPACVVSCPSGHDGPDGCGGFCACPTGETRKADGYCTRPVAFARRSGVDLPTPLSLLPTDPVGAIPGFFSVTDRGQASYRIPIEVPPGRVGMEPRLGLQYLSTKADGMLGIGWSLTGLSTISRCRSILDRDGRTDPVELGPGDRFCLDGQPLIHVCQSNAGPPAAGCSPAGQYGEDGQEYRTEIETFARVVSHGSYLLPSTGTYKGPDSFTVWTKEGRVLTYSGLVRVGAVSRVWALTRVADRAGNHLDISYVPKQSVSISHDHGQNVAVSVVDAELLPDSIAYGGNLDPGVAGTAGSEHTRFVKFEYETRPDAVKHYVSGHVGYSSSRLNAITTYVGDHEVKKYELTYDQHAAPDELTAPSQLAIVRECAIDPLDDVRRCKGTTTVQYYDPLTPGSLGSIDTGDSSFWSTQKIILDANGDGRDDIVAVTPNGWRLLINRWNAAPSTGVGTRHFDVGPLGNWHSGIVSPECAGVVDLNRDGKDDIVSLCEAHALISNGTGFDVLEMPNLAPNENLLPLQSKTVLADTNGDGLKDLVACRRNETLQTKVVTYLNTGTAFGQPVQTPPVASTCQDFLVFDTDGDGDEDIVFGRSGGGTVVRYDGFGWVSYGPQLPAPDSFRLLDFNGDGLRDAVAIEAIPVTPPYGASYILHRMSTWLNTGVGFAVTVTMFDGHNMGAVRAMSSAVVADGDGDGRDDIYLWGSRYRMVGQGQVERSTTTAFLNAPRVISADFDGDGNPEYVTTDVLSSIYQGFGSGRARLLRQVTDGVGRRHAVRYDGLTLLPTSNRFNPGPPTEHPYVPTYDPSGCTASGGLVCQTKVGPLVSHYGEAQVWSVAGTESIRAGAGFRYQYLGSRAGLGGRGTYGFSSRVVDSSTAKTVYTYYNDTFRLAGKRASITSFPNEHQPSLIGDEDRYQETRFYWTTLANGGTPPIVFLGDTLHSEYEDWIYSSVISRTSVNYSLPDPYGYSDRRTVTTSNAQGVVEIATSRSTPYHDPASWVIGLVTDQETTSTRNGQVLRATRNTFDYNRRLLIGVERLGTDQGAGDPSRITTFMPDAFGNIEETCSVDTAMNPRCSKVVEWDEQQIFPVAVRDTEDMKTEYLFGAEGGELLAVTDANGTTTEQAYDAFGRVQQIKSPGGAARYSYAARQPTQTVFGAGFQVYGAFAVIADIAGSGQRESVFDAFGRQVQSSVPGFDRTLQEDRIYNEQGWLLQVSRPHGPTDASEGTTSLSYDILGRLTSIAQADGTVEERFYANAISAAQPFRGTLTSESSTLTLTKLPRGNVRLSAHDPRGLVVRTAEADGMSLANETSTRYVRGPFGDLTDVFGPHGATHYGLDDWGRPIAAVDPSTGYRQTRFDGFDALVRETDARNEVTSYRYDRLGRLVDKLDANDEVIAHWEYDGDGTRPNELGRLVGSWRRANADTDTGSWTFTRYNSDGFASAVEYHIGATVSDEDGGETFTTSYTYDDPNVPGRLSTVTYPAGSGAFRIGYGYGSSGTIDTVFPVDANGNAGSPLWTLTDSDGGYRLGREVFGNGIVSTRTYLRPGDCTGGANDSCRGQLSTIQINGPSETRTATHHWDANGNLRQLAHTLESGVVMTDTAAMTYDGHDRLIGEVLVDAGGTSIRDYGYDAAGNITFKTGIGAYIYEHPTGSDPELKTAGGTTFYYDANGNMTERIGPLAQFGYQALDYNDFDMPHRITSGSGPSAVETNLEYTAGGERVVQHDRVSGNSQGRRRVSIGGLYERTTEPGVPTEHRFKVLVGSRQVAEVLRRSVDPERVLYIHGDHLGSTSVITDQSGGIVETRTYSAFGEHTSAGSASGVLAGYTGHNDDFQLGLTNMRGRLYDQKLGRFLTPDPFVANAASSQGWNRYAYVENNPLRFVDPSGFQGYDCGASGSGRFCQGGSCISDGPLCYPTGGGDQGGGSGGDQGRGAADAAEAAARADAQAAQAGMMSGASSAEAAENAARGEAEAQRAAQAMAQGAAAAATGQPTQGYSQPTLAPMTPGVPTSASSPLSTRQQNWDAAKAGAWNWMLDQVVGLAGVPTLLGDPLGSSGLADLATGISRTLTSPLRASEPTDPGLQKQYEFMQQGLTFLGLAAAVVGGGGGSRFSRDQVALIDLAKGARDTGISRAEAEMLLSWAQEYRVLPYSNHIDISPQHWIGGPHIRIGPINHIRVTP